MSIYDSNLETIKKYRQELYVLLENHEKLQAQDLGVDKNGFQLGADDSLVTSGVEVIEKRQVLYAVKNEKLYQLDSMYDSAKALEEWGRSSERIPEGKYYILGLGNGMYVHKLQEIMDENARVFIYEPSLSLLKTVLENFDVRNIISDGRITIFPAVLESFGVQLFKSLGHSVDYSDIPNVRTLVYPNYDILFPEAKAYFDDRIEEILTSMESNRSVYERFGKYFAINGIYNAQYIKKSLDTYDLAEKFPKDFPAIIVSAGPSLSKNVELLRDIRNRALIVACDSSVKVLLRHNLVPDIFVSVDADKSPAHFDEDIIKKIPIVGDFSTCRGALEEHAGPYYFAKTENPHLTAFFENEGITLPKLGTGGSVANTAMSFIIELGIKKIILIGQDLAYTGDKSHAEGATRASWGLDLDKNSCMVEAMDGGMIKSSGEFVHYRNWFERTISVCPDVEVINATEGGARIHGAKEMTFADAIVAYCNQSVDVENAIRSAKPLMSEEQKERFDVWISNVRTGVNQMAGDLKNGIRAYESMLDMVYSGKYANSQFKKLFEKTTAITAAIDGAACLYYVECMVQKEMTELLKSGSQKKDNDRDELIAAINEGKARFELLLEGTKRMTREVYE